MEQTVTFDDVKKATLDLAISKGRAAAIELLTAFGVERASQVKVDDWREYVLNARFIMRPKEPVPAPAPMAPYFQQQLAEEGVLEAFDAFYGKKVAALQPVPSTALPPIAGLSFLPDVAKHSHQVNPGGVVRFGSADLL
jgi:hypothetical protein